MYVTLRKLERFDAPAFGRFLEENRPFSLRIEGTLAESGGVERLWVDDEESPSLLVHRTMGRLGLLGSPEAAVEHLGNLEKMAAEMDAAGEKPRHLPPEGENCVLRLNAAPPEMRDTLARERSLVRENGCGLFTLSEEEFTPFEEGPPVGRIREDEIPIVSKFADYGEIESYVSERIARAPHAAVRVGGELAAYMIVHDNGSIGMLHILEKFRNRKLGRRVASALARIQLERGRPVYCYIVDGNAPSARVFTSLGFRRAADVSWVVYERRAD